MSAAPASSRNPLKAFLDIRRDELPLAAAMFGYFFLVITTFWILKTIKKELFVRFYDQQGLDLLGWSLKAAEAELLAKLLNMLVAAVAVVAFSALSNRFTRHRLTLIFCGFFGLCFLGYAAALDQPGHLLVWSFYLFGDLYSTLMVATFFAFLNDSVEPAAARRLYGPIILGGVGGGAFGSMVVLSHIGEVGRSSWVWISLLITGVVAGLALFAGPLVEWGRTGAAPAGAAAPPAEEAPQDSNPALAGARLVRRSSYLLAIVSIVGVYEIISTILDFQFTATVAHYLDGPEISKQFARVYTITNVAALLVQLCLTSALMSRFRLTVSLLVTPVAVIAASGTFLAVPLLWPGSLLSSADNALAYSINQSAREALYTPARREEKYKAKAFIDMFVQRLAKSVAVGISLLMSSVFTSFGGIRYLSIFTIAFASLWVLAARHAGRRFHQLSGEGETAGERGERGTSAG